MAVKSRTYLNLTPTEIQAANMVSAGKTSQETAQAMKILIRRPYAYLEKELRTAFDGQEDVKVIVDRRYRERRESSQPVALERRRADRRRPKEELVEVLLSA